MREYFKTLGLPENASYEEVKTARIKLLKKFHPDLYTGSKKIAELKTTEINRAFEEILNYFEKKNDIKINEENSKDTERKKEVKPKGKPQVKSEFKIEVKPKSKSEVKPKIKRKNNFKDKSEIVGQRTYDIKDEEKVIKELSDKIEKKEYDKKNGKKLLDMFLYLLILTFVVLVFILIFS